LEVNITVNLSSCRRFILTGAALLVGVALIVAAGVIPPVTADTYPSATPERAVPALWVIVVLHILVATVLVFIAIRTTGRSRLPTIVLGFLAFLTIVLGYAFTDGAFAYRGHGPAM